MKAKHYLFLMLAWMVLIWTLSSLPAEDIPSVKIWGIDKIAHLGIYLVWGIWTVLFLHKSKASKAVVWSVFALMLIIAALDEYHQHFIPGRQVSVYDLLANIAGLVIAFGLYFIRRTGDLT